MEYTHLESGVMGYLHPESISPVKIIVAGAATLAGLAVAGGMVATGLAALPTMGLMEAVMLTPLGSGLLLGGISAAGFACARIAAKVRGINRRQLAALEEAEKTGIMPGGNPYRLLDAGLEASPLAIDVARVGGVIAGVIGAVSAIGAAMATGGAAVPLWITAAAGLGIGMATHSASRVAEDAMAYAEQKTREASRALRGATSPMQWARDPEALVGVEYTYPRDAHFVNKYLEQQAAQEVAVEELRAR